jgi:hypothetical protein
MDSPLARVILTVLGGYFILILFLVAYEWFKDEYPRPAAKPVSVARIQHPFYHELAVDALQRFSRLPKPEKDSFKQSLESNLISMEQWLTGLDQSNYKLMCIGEHHEESTRKFLAEEFFAKISVDVLMLEATPKELKRLIQRMNSGRTYFPLLDADIMKILRTVRAKNPSIRIFGIEETEKQQKEKRVHPGSRDESIAVNFWKKFHPGMLHIILFGALHCTNETYWLFEYMNGQAPQFLKNRMLNAWVLGEHQNGALEAFVFFLDQIGIEKKNFVIPDTSALHPRVYELFQEMNRQVLKKFHSLIVFRV